MGIDSANMSSGVQVNSQCLDSFQELKLGKKTQYIVFKLSADNTQIEVEKTSPSASYDDFLNDLPPNSPRYAVYDFEYEKDGGKRNKICFYAWSPDEAKIKEKMLYASSKDALRRSLVGVANRSRAPTRPRSRTTKSSTRSRAVPRKESAARDSTLPSSIFFPPPRHPPTPILSFAHELLPSLCHGRKN